ncbi:MAG TPA: acetolactate synthase small subunit [Nitrospinota bacterium]|nr:acetolactate synthase small subunit [Nitrospinota bacterium]
MKNKNREKNTDEKCYTIGVLVENRFGVLSRIAGLFSGRGYNIDSLSVAETLDPTVSRMTIVTKGNEHIIEQIMKQLNKLIDVIRVIDLSEEKYVDRELVLIKVNAKSSVRAELLRITDIFRGNIVDVNSDTYTIEVTGDEDKIQAIIDLMKPMGIKEIVKTGKIAISRGSKVLNTP